MQCPVCHNEVEPQAAFCNHCGASLSAPAPAADAPQAAAPPPSYPPPAYPQTPPPGYPPPASGGGLAPNTAAAIAYITFIPAILFLLIEPYNKTPLVRFHSFQSIGLSVVAFLLHIIFRILLFPFGFGLIWMVQDLISLGLFVLWLIAIIKASQGEFYKLPVIGDFALKQAQS